MIASHRSVPPDDSGVSSNNVKIERCYCHTWPCVVIVIVIAAANLAQITILPKNDCDNLIGIHRIRWQCKQALATGMSCKLLGRTWIESTPTKS